MMAQSTKTKNVCLPRRHVIGIKYQMKTTNVQKAYRIAPPKMCALFMILHLNTTCTHMRSSLSIYIIQTLVMFKKGKKLQYQFKERCFTQSRIAFQRIAHYREVWLLNVNAQELVHCFSQLKKAQNKFWVEQQGSKRYKKDKWELDQNKSLAIK
jgi:hypothetical protein